MGEHGASPRTPEEMEAEADVRQWRETADAARMAYREALTRLGEAHASLRGYTRDPGRQAQLAAYQQAVLEWRAAKSRLKICESAVSTAEYLLSELYSETVRE